MVFSLTSMFRGILGMGILLLIAFLFSVNRRQIAWRTVGLGLLCQIIIAVGVLKIDFIKRIFESLGNFFIKILEYTGEGYQDVTWRIWKC